MSETDMAAADDAVKVSSITVDASEGIRPPADIVSWCEGHPGVTHLKATEYEASGRPRMIVTSIIGVSTDQLPDGWTLSYVKARDGDTVLSLTTDRTEADA
jgi:hypothetical protein